MLRSYPRGIIAENASIVKHAGSGDGLSVSEASVDSPEMACRLASSLVADSVQAAIPGLTLCHLTAETPAATENDAPTEMPLSQPGNLGPQPGYFVPHDVL